MNIHTVIDDQLFHQAVYMTGMADNRMLLEYALRSLLQVQETRNLEKTTQSKFDFWERLQHFRGSVNLSELGDIDEIFSNVRDKDSGRTIVL